MINYRCFGCVCECKVVIEGKVFKSPDKCLMTGGDMEWSKVTDISQLPKEEKDKQEAVEVMERIKMYFLNVHYPIRHCMYDRTHTVGEMFDKALRTLKEKK
ncbi:MAG: hypothetical protein GY853_10060 [PVC group bacterium]|nr:hypothetical protein [PVC group bacterium]